MTGDSASGSNGHEPDREVAACYQLIRLCEADGTCATDVSPAVGHSSASQLAVSTLTAPVPVNASTIAGVWPLVTWTATRTLPRSTSRWSASARVWGTPARASTEASPPAA